jgi:hypothetical protein
MEGFRVFDDHPEDYMSNVENFNEFNPISENKEASRGNIDVESNNKV